MQPKIRNAGISRRVFLASATLAGVGFAIGCTSRNRGNWRFLTEDQARTLGAVCDQIIPQDDYPSASQAGVINYIDLQLTRHFRRYQSAYRDGIAKADQVSIRHSGKSLAEASMAEQFDAVSALERENKEFFELVRTHTMQGYYGSPRHGGNRDAMSWRMLGVAEPPLRGRAHYSERNGAAS